MRIQPTLLMVVRGGSKQFCPGRSCTGTGTGCWDRARATEPRCLQMIMEIAAAAAASTSAVGQVVPFQRAAAMVQPRRRVLVVARPSEQQRRRRRRGH